MAVDFPTSPAVGQVVSGTGISWRWDGTAWVIATGAPSAHGVLAYAQITANTANVTVETAIPGLSVSWVADPTRRYRISFQGDISGSVAHDIPVLFIKNGAAIVTRTTFNLGNQINISETKVCSIDETGLSGTQTRFVSLTRAIGTGTVRIDASPGAPAWIMVEDVTYEGPAPSTLASTKVGRWRRVAGLSVVPVWPTQITWDTEDFDPYSMWSSGYVLTIPESGVWAITATVLFNAIQNARAFAQITASTQIAVSAMSPRAICTTDDRATVTAELQLNGGDTFTIDAFTQAGATINAALQVAKVGNLS